MQASESQETYFEEPRLCSQLPIQAGGAGGRPQRREDSPGRKDNSKKKLQLDSVSDKYVVLGGSGCSQDENRRLWNVSIYHRINTNHYYCSILNVSSCAVPSFKTDPLLL